GSAKRRRQQLLAVKDLHHAVIADAPCGVDVVADHVIGRRAARQLAGSTGMLVRGDGTVKRGGSRSGCTWLPARQSEGADVMRVRRLATIDDRHRLVLTPAWRDVR